MAKIVPFIGELLKNRYIPDVILTSYFSLEPTQPNSFDEIPEGYIGRLERFNQPFFVNYFGTYIMIWELAMIEHKIKIGEYSFDEVKKYANKMGEGFLYGYQNFEKDIVEAKTGIFSNDENRARVIYDYANGSLPRYKGVFNVTMGKGVHPFSKWYESGIKRGYYYRAWYIILENYTMFEKYFIPPASKKPVFVFKDKGLKDWILPANIDKFKEIEKELFEREYIDNSYQWKKHKTELVDFVCVIDKYFRPIVKGKRIQDFHKRQFISERYGYEKTGLTDTWKKRNPKLETAKITFFWIEPPK